MIHRSHASLQGWKTIVDSRIGRLRCVIGRARMVGWCAAIFLASMQPTLAQQPYGGQSFGQPIPGRPNNLPAAGNNVGVSRQSFQNPQPIGNQNSFAPNAGYSDPRVASNPNMGNANSNGPANAAPVATGKESGIQSRNLLQLFHTGGLMMYPIALCSFIMTVFTFERFIYLRTGRVIPRPFVKRLTEQLQQQQIDRDEAIELCERNPSPMAAICMAAVKKYGKPAVEVEQAVLDAGERESNQLRRYMRLFNAISNVAPLLGMLGTVTGMIQSFRDISGAQAMGRPEALAGGISEALLTTAAGLMVAIPAYLLYIYFQGRTDKLIMEMDSHAQRLVEVVSAEGLQENDSSRTRARTRKAA